MEKSSPSRTAGIAFREITLAGQKFLLSQPDRVRKAADEEAVVISRRLDMLPAIARASADLATEERDAWRAKFVSTMICGIASPEEWANYFNSLWRLAFRFWHALDPEDKGKRTLLEGVAWAYEILNDQRVTQEEFQALDLALQLVGQEQALGESSGSPEGATP